MLIAVRHGKTSSNEQGHEKLRGWLPIGLNEEGMEDSQRTADYLSDLEGVDGIYCSDLVRTVQSADPICRVLGLPLQATDRLRDLNTGDFAGGEISPALLKTLQDYILHPDKVIPGGESVGEWIDRVGSMFKMLVESHELNIAVVHGRGMTLLLALCKTQGDYPDVDTLLLLPPVSPSGVMIVGHDWKLVYMSQKEPDQSRLS